MAIPAGVAGQPVLEQKATRPLQDLGIRLLEAIF